MGIERAGTWIAQCSVALLSVLLALGVVSTAVAQDTGEDAEEPSIEERANREPGPDAPQDTEIKLPELLLEVEEAQLEQVQAELPQTAEARRGEVGVPLPTEAELAISPAAFEIPGPEGDGANVTTEPSDTVSLFSDAVLGAGSMNHILGSLSLYRLGESPRFRLQFSHDGRDGYNFEEAGTGYFDRTEELSGWIEGGKTTTGRLELGFIEHERGLQGQPTFFSTKSRFLEGSGELDVPFAEQFRFSPRVDAGYAERLRSVADESLAPAGAESFAHPGARVNVDTDVGTFYTDMSYLFQYFEDDDDAVAQGFGLAIGADLLLGRQVAAGAEVGVLWPLEDYVYVPFTAEITATPGDAWTMSLEGGMEAKPLRFAERWQDLPTFATADDDGEIPGWTEEWYGQAGVRVDVPDSPITSEVSGRVAWLHSVPDLLGYVEETGAITYELEDRLSFEPEATMRFDFSPLGFEAGWHSILLDRAKTDPLHDIRLGAEIKNQEETMGARADFSEEVYQGLSTPELDLSGYLDVTESVRISADLLDVFAPLMKEGRPRIGEDLSDDFPFVAPGFRFVLKTRVSL